VALIQCLTNLQTLRLVGFESQSAATQMMTIASTIKLRELVIYISKDWSDATELVSFDISSVSPHLETLVGNFSLTGGDPNSIVSHTLTLLSCLVDDDRDVAQIVCFPSLRQLALEITSQNTVDSLSTQLLRLPKLEVSRKLSS
jgi:hypothetical protein